MPDPFDPYHRWLGIAPKDQPPNHYRLLGIDLFEDDPEVIRDAADRQMVHVRTYQLGQYSDLSQKILNELAAAKLCLLDPKSKTRYDAWLRTPPEPEARDSAHLRTVLSSDEETIHFPSGEIASPPTLEVPCPCSMRA